MNNQDSGVSMEKLRKIRATLNKYGTSLTEVAEIYSFIADCLPELEGVRNTIGGGSFVSVDIERPHPLFPAMQVTGYYDLSFHLNVDRLCITQHFRWDRCATCLDDVTIHPDKESIKVICEYFLDRIK